MIVEGGWSSDDAAAFSGTSPQEQAEYFRRFAALLNGVQGEAWVILFYADSMLLLLAYHQIDKPAWPISSRWAS